MITLLLVGYYFQIKQCLLPMLAVLKPPIISLELTCAPRDNYLYPVTRIFGLEIDEMCRHRFNTHARPYLIKTLRQSGRIT
uniref:Uncharacterized protein n=1 Tax=Pararge aegeria TaxID=116150 RepID=S4P8G8_9NEOP